ncbi:hypothetical protein B5E58_03820 [Tyzzerella sp. An114]|uniref:tetratricopeptide repeat protein n=1 Tax=Tyzzerella sp. An114 TaxID=1965545 RepID=UPI000B4468D5|nr:tetratricopeptide repeat protein [Tyzzerella sp. An114]OUQ59571.1 hypothetical protein B5E58_03820 [Tyzzerella sp. An114]
MKCPNCGKSFSFGNICPHCNADIYLYNKTINASIKLYNKGLDMAKKGDMASAEKFLEHSVMFNKYNVTARNLLGLVYFERGRIGNALKEWIVSSSIKKENNPAKTYIDKVYKNPREMDKMNDAVHMYNQAIIYAKQDTIDLAIIQLKKAVSVNPKLIEAYNLLVLCYIKIKKYSLARKYLNRLLKRERKNEKALKYLVELNILSPSKSKKSQIDYYDDEIENVSSRKKAKNSLPYKEYKKRFIKKGEIIAFITGAFCSAAVVMALLLPSMIDTRDNEIINLKNQIEQITSTETDEKTLEIENLKAENENLKKQLEKNQNILYTQENTALVKEALNLEAENNYEECAVKILEIKPEYLAEKEKLQYDTLVESVYPKASQSFYNKGKSDFLSNNYNEAKINLENCLKFANGENFVDDAIYYLGKIAENNGDIDTAKSYYQRIISEFPQSNQYKNAETSLGNIE